MSNKKLALSRTRNVQEVIINGAAPIDAMKAVVDFIETFELKYQEDNTITLPTGAFILTGTDKTLRFDVEDTGSNLLTASYTFDVSINTDLD